MLNTGNEYVSVPNIIAKTGAINAFGVMHEGYRACLEFMGSAEEGLIAPSVVFEGKELCADFESSLHNYWIPTFNKQTESISIAYNIIAPLERRGFICLLYVKNISSKSISAKAGWKGIWKGVSYSSMNSNPMNGSMHIFKSELKGNPLVFEFKGEAPVAAFSLLGEVDFNSNENNTNYDALSSFTLEPDETKIIPLYVGVGIREVSAVANAKEMSIQNWKRLHFAMVKWLKEHTINSEEPFIKEVMNVHSFYNYFYSQAMTLDTENYVLTSARSSNDHGCATYSDKDAMRWSLPAVLQMNWAQARKLIIYGFTTQLKNIGTKTRFIDGTVLEPGFALDQLCAPIRALQIYVQLTEDLSILFDRRIQIGVNTIQQILAAQRNSKKPIFETLLTPSGEYCEFPYICYSNVLVWRILDDIGNLYAKIRDMDRAEEAIKLANQVKEAIMETFVVDGQYGKMFAFAADTNGKTVLGDDPQGSLKLLTFLKFCQSSDELYKNTIKWINSENYKNSNKLSDDEVKVIEAANDLLGGSVDEAISSLKLLQGYPLTQSASAAGYLAFGLRIGTGAKPSDASFIKENQRPSETLYQPPPEQKHTTKKARV